MKRRRKSSAVAVRVARTVRKRRARNMVAVWVSVVASVVGCRRKSVLVTAGEVL